MNGITFHRLKYAYKKTALDRNDKKWAKILSTNIDIVIKEQFRFSFANIQIQITRESRKISKRNFEERLMRFEKERLRESIEKKKRREKKNLLIVV